MNILFMGTPAFARASLEVLTQSRHAVVGVYTQPDKKQNRGMKLTPSAVKEFAITQGIPVFTPDTLREEAVQTQIAALQPDLIVVAAYGKLLPESILNLPPYGCINVHSSLLPKYRGAAPIQWAILDGERETGVTIMHMVKALDAGDIIAKRQIAIGANETAEELHDRLMTLGAALLLETIDAIETGKATREPQREADVTYAAMLSRKLSPMDWRRSAAALHNQVRGLFPWPSATAVFGETKFKILETRLTGEHTELAPGKIVQADDDGIRVACGTGSILRITRLQAEGGKQLNAADYLRGHSIGDAPFVSQE